MSASKPSCKMKHSPEAKEQKDKWDNNAPSMSKDHFHSDKGNKCHSEKNDSSATSQENFKCGLSTAVIHPLTTPPMPQAGVSMQSTRTPPGALVILMTIHSSPVPATPQLPINLRLRQIISPVPQTAGTPRYLWTQAFMALGALVRVVSPLREV